MSAISIMRAVGVPKVAAGAAAAAGVGVVAYGTRDGGSVLGKEREFWAGLGAGVVGAFALKAGLRHVPGMGGVMNAAQKIPGGAAGKFVAATAIGTIPSYALLAATRGDRELLGQGHEFWSGAVWGLAGVALLKTAFPISNIASHGPLAAGWVAGDFVAIGLDTVLGGGTQAARRH